MTPLKIAEECVKALESKKGLDVKILEVERLTTLADYIVIATGTSSTHVNALADEVEFKLKEAGVTVSHIEGHKSASWILLDYGSVIVHVFSDEARKFYNLDRLWE